ncbi:MAG: radical SAM protein [Nitrososphaerales archaeon]
MVYISVILVNPPQRNDIGRALGIKAPPIGLMYLAAVLREAGEEVEILDADLLELSVEDAAKEVCLRQPSIVGVTATTPTINNALKVVGSVRARNAGVITVIGGVHPTFMPEETLQSCPALDLVVIGEGEQTLLELTRALKGFQWDGRRYSTAKEFAERVSTVKGIAYRDPSNPNLIRYTPPRPYIDNLDKIPLPARDLVPFEHYKLLGKEASIGAIITSRGCPYGCTYCSSSRIGGLKFRARSVDNVLLEIQELYHKYHLKHIEIIDDIFTLNQKRAFEFAQKLKNLNLDVEWHASSRVNTISRDLVRALFSAGLRTLYYGVESGSQRILDLMRKKIRLEQVRDAFRITREEGVMPFGSFILGYPTETLDEMKQTIKFAAEINAEYAQFCVLTPYPGTPVYYELKSKGLLLTEDWDRYTTLEPVIRYEVFGYTAKQVKKMLNYAYQYFYLRPRYILRHLRLLPTIFGVALRNYVLPMLGLDRIKVSKHTKMIIHSSSE